MTERETRAQRRNQPGQIGALWISAVACWWIGTLLPIFLVILSQCVDSPLFLFNRYAIDSDGLSFKALKVGLPFWIASALLYSMHRLRYDPPEERSDLGDFRLLQPWAVGILTPTLFLGGIVSSLLFGLGSTNYFTIPGASSCGCHVIVGKQHESGTSDLYDVYLSNPRNTKLRLIGHGEVHPHEETYQQEYVNQQTKFEWDLQWSGSHPRISVRNQVNVWHMDPKATCGPGYN